MGTVQTAGGVVLVGAANGFHQRGPKCVRLLYRCGWDRHKYLRVFYATRLGKTQANESLNYQR
jgi:hypothetical protein